MSGAGNLRYCGYSMLRTGDAVPHRVLTDVSGRDVSYADEVWQKRNIVLVALPQRVSVGDAGYIADLDAARGRFAAAQTEVIVTRDSVPGLAPYAVLVADRWGEIVTAQRTGTPSELHSVERILAWVEFVQYQCPECQGETR